MELGRRVKAAKKGSCPRSTLLSQSLLIPSSFINIIDIRMDEDDFEDLFSEAELLQPSTQGSLIDTAADMTIDQDEADASPNAPKQDYILNGAHSPVKQTAMDIVYPKYDRSTSNAEHG